MGAHVVGAHIDLIVGGVFHRVDPDILVDLRAQRADECVADRANPGRFEAAAGEHHFGVGAGCSGRCNGTGVAGGNGDGSKQKHRGQHCGGRAHGEQSAGQ